MQEMLAWGYANVTKDSKHHDYFEGATIVEQNVGKAMAFSLLLVKLSIFMLVH